jgi:hypothetical protein
MEVSMDQDQVNNDLRFVRAVVEGSDRDDSPAVIFFLWAVVGLVGFALVDFQPTWVPAYWSIAAPAGFLVSAVLGWRHARRSGQVTPAVGRRYLLHWGGMLAATFLAVLMPIGGLLAPEALGPAILLILALAYFEAGVHLDRAFLWVGLLMGAGYVFVVFVTGYAWTVVGLVVALGLSIAGLRRGRLHEAAA